MKFTVNAAPGHVDVVTGVRRDSFAADTAFEHKTVLGARMFVRGDFRSRRHAYEHRAIAVQGATLDAGLRPVLPAGIAGAHENGRRTVAGGLMRAAGDVSGALKPNAATTSSQASTSAPHNGHPAASRCSKRAASSAGRAPRAKRAASSSICSIWERSAIVQPGAAGTSNCPKQRTPARTLLLILPGGTPTISAISVRLNPRQYAGSMVSRCSGVRLSWRARARLIACAAAALREIELPWKGDWRPRRAAQTADTCSRPADAFEQRFLGACRTLLALGFYRIPRLTRAGSEDSNASRAGQE
jgi:hypothetical protein